MQFVHRNHLTIFSLFHNLLFVLALVMWSNVMICHLIHSAKLLRPTSGTLASPEVTGETVE